MLVVDREPSLMVRKTKSLSCVLDDVGQFDTRAIMLIFWIRTPYQTSDIKIKAQFV